MSSYIAFGVEKGRKRRVMKIKGDFSYKMTNREFKSLKQFKKKLHVCD